MPSFQEADVAVDQLLLDPNNFRFRDDPDFRPVNEKRFAEDSVQNRARARLREESLVELKRSIIANGFLPVERIVTRKYEHDEKKFVVLEGNRRVAALKWIAEDHAAGVDIPPNVLATLKEIPILILKSEDDLVGVYESIMGIRHVSGIKEWGGYQRAQLITELRDTHGLDAQTVAERLGMSVREVNRRYKAYKALEQMADDEDYADHATAKLYPLFHEAVALPSVRVWMNWSDDDNCFLNYDELHQFYQWITPHDDPDEEELMDAKIKSHRDVRDLPAILADAEALSVLRDSGTNFSEAITLARREQIARAWKGQIASATGALKSMSVHELTAMQQEDLKLLKDLQVAVKSTLTSYEKLSQ